MIPKQEEKNWKLRALVDDCPAELNVSLSSSVSSFFEIKWKHS